MLKENLIKTIIFATVFLFVANCAVFAEESIKRDSLLSPRLSIDEVLLKQQIKENRWKDYLEQAEAYQKSLNKNFDDKDKETLAMLGLPDTEIAKILQKNLTAFVPKDQGILEQSIFISMDVGYSSVVRDYAQYVQNAIVSALGDKSKIRLNPLSKLHFTLINSEIGTDVDVSNKGIKNSFSLYADIIKEMNSFEADIIGPHLMSNLGVVLEVRTNSPEVLLFRQAAEEVLNKEKEERGVKGFVPDIIHISLGYIVNASEDELKMVNAKLKEFREKAIVIPVTAQKVQTVKTINKSMYKDGAIIKHLIPVYHRIIVEAI